MTAPLEPGVEVEAAERKAISSLRRLAKTWPKSLKLFAWSGTLCVMRNGVEPCESAVITKIDGFPMMAVTRIASHEHPNNNHPRPLPDAERRGGNDQPRRRGIRGFNTVVHESRMAAGWNVFRR